MRTVGQSPKDRTPEFQAIVERLKKSQGASTSGSPAVPVSTNAGQSPQFSARAQAMSLQISQLAGRIQQLTRLAKQTSMFEDNSTQINSLTGQVKADLQSLNAELQELQVLSGRAGAGGQSGNHASRIVDNLRVQLKGTTDNFKTVLDVRRDALQASQERRNLFASTSESTSAYQPGSFFSAEAQRPGDDSTNGLLAQQQEQQLAMAPQADAYLQSRDAALQQINHTIQELGGIFTQVAALVQEQGDIAVRIDDNVDNVVSNVDAAQTELLKYLQTISTNRWLALKILGVVLFFIMLFIFVS